MPYLEDTLTREFLPVTGQTRTPFCKVFDRQSWTWITSNLFFVEEAEEFVRMDLDLKGSHFAVSEVTAGPEPAPSCSHQLSVGNLFFFKARRGCGPG
eukprot:3345861-Rhodomonas_salina.3